MTFLNELLISPQIANNALWYFSREEGFSGGHASDLFFELCSHADSEYLDRLAAGFPGEVLAFRMGKSVDGRSELREIAAKPTEVGA
jgi:hypothetical protein